MATDEGRRDTRRGRTGLFSRAGLHLFRGARFDWTAAELVVIPRQAAAAVVVATATATTTAAASIYSPGASDERDVSYGCLWDASRSDGYALSVHISWISMIDN